MALTSGQIQALQHARILLLDPAAGEEDRVTAGRLFHLGEDVAVEDVERLLPREVIVTLESLGLIARRDGAFTAAPYRLVQHLDLLLFCHRVSAHGKFYYGPDSLVLSRVLHQTEGRVLDLCAGVGAQALTCARTAASVTAVEIEPLAGPIFTVNAAMNDLSDRVEFLAGDLYGPVAGRRFDFICANPPFLPVAPGIGFPLWAGGGSDGLDIVRRILAGLPDFLMPGGECQIIAAACGGGDGPRLDTVEELASALGLRVEVSCYTYEPLDRRVLGSFALTATACPEGVDAGEAYREHFARLGATHLFYFVLRAARVVSPS